MPALTPEQEALKQAALAATPQNFDSAECGGAVDGYVECPCCGGEGTVDLTADYCNYDDVAMGVQFYGIGDEHKNAEAYYRLANPAAILALLARLEEYQADYGQAVDSVAQLQEEVFALQAQLEAVPSIPAQTGMDTQCGCWKCIDSRGGMSFGNQWMVLCPTCGNKRCPHAKDHNLACTNSNEPGQPGSAYGPAQDAPAECAICDGTRTAFGKACECADGAVPGDLQ